MKYFTIKAIKAGTLTLPKPSLAGGSVDEDLMIEFPFTCFLLRNGDYFLGSHDPGNIYKKYWG